MEFVVNGNANTLLAFAHAERAGKLHFIGEMVALDKILELFNDLARTLHDEPIQTVIFIVVPPETLSLILIISK